MKTKKTKVKGSTKAFNLTVSESDNKKYHLRLFTTGVTNRSVTAISNIKEICEDYLEGQYKLEVIDLYKKPQLATEEQIIAAPTLIKKRPLPFRRIIGDMSDRDKVLIGLNLIKIR